MRAACKAMRPSAAGSTATPIWRSNFAIVRTSISCGTLESRRGCALRSAAHMIGSAAFFAPETRTSPSSGRPPRMRSLSTGAPFLRREGAHRQRVDLFAHALAERRIDQLVALHAAAAGEFGGDDERLEMLAVARHLDVLAGEPGRDPLLDAFRRNHQCLSL